MFRPGKSACADLKRPRNKDLRQHRPIDAIVMRLLIVATAIPRLCRL